MLIFLEELPGAQGPRLSALGQTWLGLVVQAVQVGVVPDAMLVPVAITYDLVPDAPCDVYQVSSAPGDSPKWTHCCVLWPSPLRVRIKGTVQRNSPVIILWHLPRL